MFYFCFIGSVPLVVKLLDQPRLRSKGFMGWNQPPNDYYGMLFHHDIEHLQSYWMHTVPFNLDCLGFDKENRLVEIMPLYALSKVSRSFSAPVRHVVEVRSGWCQDKGIKGKESLVIKKL